MDDNQKGYVYILTNPSFKDDWIKIGKCAREVDLRIKELYTTALPLPFEVYATLYTKKFNEVEKIVHQSIDRISSLRIRKNREFFNISPEKAYEILADLSTLLDDSKLELYGDNIDRKIVKQGEKRRVSERFDFFTAGLKIGDKITFVDDDTIIATVIDERRVKYNDIEYYLSALARDIYESKGKCTASGSYQGPAYFKFNNKTLNELFIDNLKSKVVATKEI